MYTTHVCVLFIDIQGNATQRNTLLYFALCINKGCIHIKPQKSMNGIILYHLFSVFLLNH